MKKESSYKFLTVIIILISILFFSGCAKSDLAGEAFKGGKKPQNIIKDNLNLDFNGNGVLDDGDVDILEQVILFGDINGDGEIDVADVVALTNMIEDEIEYSCCFAQDNFCQDSLTAQECCGSDECDSEVFSPGVPCTYTQCEWLGCCLDTCKMTQYMDCGTNFTFVDDLSPTYRCDSAPECAPEDNNEPFISLLEWTELVNGFNVTFMLNDASNMTVHLGVLSMCIGDQCFNATSSEGYCFYDAADNLEKCNFNLILQGGPGEYTLVVWSEDIYGNAYNYTETRSFEAEPGDTSPPVITFYWSNYGNNTVVNVTAIDNQSYMAWLNLSISPSCDPDYYTDCTENVCNGFAISNCGQVNYTVTAHACDVEGNCASANHLN